MRLWTLHPKYLDARGLVALWREALLAQQVLRGRTKGYRRHPQLARFLSQPRPVASIARYLAAVHLESRARGYRFDRSKIGRVGRASRLAETEGQLLHEWSHLKRKLRERNVALYRRLRRVPVPDPHPMFRIIKGDARSWELARKDLPIGKMGDPADRGHG
jgi:hypothetical protein